MAFVLATVMDGIAAYAVAQGVTAEAYGTPIPNPSPPCLIIGYPTKLDFDLTFHALGTTGKVEATFPLWFVCGAVTDVSSRNALSAIITGATGIKEALDGSMGGTFLDSARVMDCKIETMMIGTVEYICALFEVDVLA